MTKRKKKTIILVIVISLAAILTMILAYVAFIIIRSYLFIKLDPKPIQPSYTPEESRQLAEQEAEARRIARMNAEEDDD